MSFRLKNYFDTTQAIFRAKNINHHEIEGWTAVVLYNYMIDGRLLAYAIS